MVHEVRFRRLWKGLEEVRLLMTPGHVGSTSLAKSLEGADPPLLNIHSLRRKTEPGKSVPDRRLFLEQFLGRRLIRDAIDRPLRILSCVRDPVAATVGGFFHTLAQFHPGHLEARVEGVYTAADTLALLLSSARHHEYMDRWFDQEIRERFRIDIFASPFPHAEGVVEVVRDDIALMVVRIEDAARRWDDRVLPFLGLDGLPLRRANAGADAPYAAVYEETKRNSLPGDWVDSVLSMRYARHFWTDDERESIRRRWCSGTA
jgi:hypothetical protein